MRRGFLVFTLLIAACGGGSKDSAHDLSRTPVSVRGWIHDVQGAKRAENFELEIARRAELFTSASIWVEETEYASGGIAENGAFIVLDVPPGKATLAFNATGAENARVPLENVPGSADVFIPDLVLAPGGATVLDPAKILIRVAADVDKPRRTDRTAKVAGYVVPVLEVPLGQMADRREYPAPPGFRPVATVK